MASHELKLIYDGLGASEHKMPPRLVKKITAGAQEFLGAHAYLFTEGKIPVNVSDHSRHFNICDLRQRDGCWEAIFTITLTGTASIFFHEFLRELTKNVAVDAAAATNTAFKWFIRRSCEAWKMGQPLHDPIFDRIEPMFSETYGNGAPMFDTELGRERESRLLFERTSSSMVKMSSPIGHAATHFDMWFDDVRLVRIDRRIYSEKEKEREIEAALLPIRKQWNGHQRSQYWL